MEATTRQSTSQKVVSKDSRHDGPSAGAVQVTLPDQTLGNDVQERSELKDASPSVSSSKTGSEMNPSSGTSNGSAAPSSTREPGGGTVVSARPPPVPIMPRTAPVMLQYPPTLPFGPLPPRSSQPETMSNHTGMIFSTRSRLQHVASAPCPRPIVPRVFENRKLRSGKWLEEEESYANVLIKLFEKGQLADCESGLTLRSYLSQKLHCAPMRISKKYAGTGIGKLVFLSKVGSTADKAVSEDVKRLQELATRKEQEFIKTTMVGYGLLQAPHLFGLLPAATTCISSNLLPGLMNISGSLGQSSSTGILLSQKPQPQVLAPSGIPKNAAVALCAALGAASASSVPPAFANLGHLAVPLVGGGPFLHPSLSLVSGPSSMSSQGLPNRESWLSLLDASQQAQPSSSQRTIPQEAEATHSTDAGVLVPAYNPQSKSLGLPPPVAASALSELATKSSQATEPDFLTGFDKVAMSMNPANAVSKIKLELAQGPLQCSPPLTSRSFDDFHQFLGTELSAAQGNDGDSSTHHGHDGNSAAANLGRDSTIYSSVTTNGSSKPQYPPSGTVDKSTPALFSAESYAMLAQESAHAASQHAAYLSNSLRQGVVATDPAIAKKQSFDTENELARVGQYLGPLFSAANYRSVSSQQQSDFSQQRSRSQDQDRQLAANLLEQQQLLYDAFQRQLQSAAASAKESNSGWTPMERLCDTTNDSSANMISSASELTNSATESDSADGSFRGGRTYSNRTNSEESRSETTRFLDDSGSNNSSISDSDCDQQQKRPARKRARKSEDTSRERRVRNPANHTAN